VIGSKCVDSTLSKTSLEAENFLIMVRAILGNCASLHPGHSCCYRHKRVHPINRRLWAFELAAAATLLASFAWAQQPARVPVVGVLVTHAAANDPSFDEFRAALREFGYEDGRNIRLEIVTAEGHLDRLPGLAQELVRQNVDVIVSPNDVSVRAAREATSAIPIVMSGAAVDPVTSGLVDSLRRPGGNITGGYELWVELDGKRLEILKEALPRVSRIAVFRDPSFPGQLGELNRAAQSLGMRIEIIEVRGPQDLEAAFRAAKRKKAGAVLLVATPIWYVHRTQVAALALDARMPLVSSFHVSVEAGALMSYGHDLTERNKLAAYYVDRMLKGAKPSDLPVQQVSRLKFAVNLKTAKALGITLPESILLRADEVIR
jgi:putative ABC transport system substrate-binding protein